MAGSIILHPTCNPITVTDKRGGIFTWVTPFPIVEMNMLYFTPQASRGEHKHLFSELLFIASGSALAVWLDTETGERKSAHVSAGSCIYNPEGISHALHAITPLVAFAGLSAEWEKTHPPIIYEDVSGLPNPQEVTTKQKNMKLPDWNNNQEWIEKLKLSDDPQDLELADNFIRVNELVKKWVEQTKIHITKTPLVS